MGPESELWWSVRLGYGSQRKLCSRWESDRRRLRCCLHPTRHLFLSIAYYHLSATVHIRLAPVDTDHQHNNHTAGDNNVRGRNMAFGVNVDEWNHLNLLFVQHYRHNNHNASHHNGYHLCVERGVDGHFRNSHLPHEQHYPAALHTDRAAIHPILYHPPWNYLYFRARGVSSGYYFYHWPSSWATTSRIHHFRHHCHEWAPKCTVHGRLWRPLSRWLRNQPALPRYLWLHWKRMLWRRRLHWPSL